MPAGIPLLVNKAPTDAQAKVLRIAVAREMALQSQLEQQHLEMENEASRAQDVASSLVNCRGASERVHRALDTLRAAVTDSRDLISNAINVHDTEAEVADEITTTTTTKNAWCDFVRLLEALTPQINSTITSTRCHIINTSNQVSSYNFLAECTRHSITALDISLDAVATSLSFKRRGFGPLFRTPDEVFGIMFQFAVEEERERLRAEFSSRSATFNSLNDMRRTIPERPFTLAAVCREWRNIALHTPKLWSYIRAYTAFCTVPSTREKQSQYCWVGKAAFEWSLRRAKGTSLELTIYQNQLYSQQISPIIPSDARFSVISLVRLPSVPQWLPTCTRLSLCWHKGSAPWYDIGSTLKVVDFPSFSTGPMEISCKNVLPTFQVPLDSTTAFYFCSERSSEMPHINQLSEKLPMLTKLYLLLPDVPAVRTHSTTTTQRTWKFLKTLSTTSSVLFSLGACAQQGLSLPSLTTLILTEVFASFSPIKCNNIQPIVQTLTSLEIHNISPSVKLSGLRAFIDWMECLETVTLHRLAVQRTVEALSIPPAKLVKRLVVEGMVLERAELGDYVGLLECPDSAPDVSE